MSGPCCFSGSEHPGTPTGRVETIYSLPTYISEPPSGAPKALVVIIPDAFGWDFKNLRILADVYAKRMGARVYMPDFMNGNAAPVSLMYTMDRALDPAASWLAVLTTKVPAIFGMIGGMVPFLFLNRQAIAEPRVRSWFSSLRANEGAATKIGAIGFCWGGKYAVLLADKKSTAPSGLPLIDAGFTAHPSNLVMPTDIENVDKPLSIAVGDVDFVFSHDQSKQAKEILEGQREAGKHEVVILPGAKHGFAVRGHPDDPKEREQAEVAEEQVVKFFRKNLGTD